MMSLDVAERGYAKHANFVHVTLRGLEETAALEHYIHERVHRQSSKGPEVQWYEVVVRGTSHHHRRGPHSARITAHLPDIDVVVSQQSDDIFLVTRDAFDVLSQRLSRIRDMRKSRARGTRDHRYGPGNSKVVH